MNNRLITITISYYCEKVRWAIEWLKILYIEESHALLFHHFATRWYGGSRNLSIAARLENYSAL